MNDIQTKSIGLVLSGGGVRGMAHIGLIQAMNEFGLSAQVVGGSSVGALVGALYANGNSVLDMMAFFKETPLFRYNFLTIAKPGFIDTDRYFDVFKTYFPQNSFDTLEKKLHVVATNLQKGDLEYFSEGELIRPLLASAALPPVFSPVEMEGQLYADGGIMNNFPLEPIMGQADYIIGSNVSVVGELNKNALKNSLQLTGRVTGLMIYAINRKKLNACNLLMEFKELEKIGVLDRKGIEKAYLVGYENTCRRLEELLKKPQV
ncbi:patatin-like phospholipase family protein [Zobellia galactanivorans]|uniref:Patatin-like phospholipase n=1 Tax=Zobellia galactanivorans (strain DSM 12802 / CCUG 47099 / CIP 106680 / NCIMB 13871 / Dsij) TaxID=63186 RepID=G0L4X3_ZOBGA|nr:MULTISPECIES: patatin-like phospholipase family protein [Zobellia]MBU3026668.1 patatin-like phospholipase family protein [Zobellia galactanivorans]MDO6809191.1 patatin-like phospholipase family protein [Zobellia galactanivorans]OWW26838.1 phospholipase [Zobellia sp. OII3]CAZ95819.1 Patatin-like phospholipase [Zobellia galactanivorans]